MVHYTPFLIELSDGLNPAEDQHKMQMVWDSDIYKKYILIENFT